jgi:NAD(P)-dependent dehydrogenase (short-subunit alcohol dehydrogenase family)
MSKPLAQVHRAASHSVFQMFRLEGKVALIIGGARHLGYDMAEALAEAGAQVIVTSRSADDAEQAADSLSRDFGVETASFALDQADAARVAEVMTQAASWKNRLDILINNAGGGSGGGACHLLERDPGDVESLIATNLTGTLHCCQAAARIMVPQGSGKIISVSSVAALVGRDRALYERNGLKGQAIDYAAAKAGILGMTRDLAGLLSPHGICVNAISPGGFERPDMPPGFVKDYSERTPLGRMGRDGVDLKGAALYLASPASDYVTGQNLVVDGGFSIWR